MTQSFFHSKNLIWLAIFIGEGNVRFNESERIVKIGFVSLKRYFWENENPTFLFFSFTAKFSISLPFQFKNSFYLKNFCSRHFYLEKIDLPAKCLNLPVNSHILPAKSRTRKILFHFYCCNFCVCNDYLSWAFSSFR